MRRTGLLLIFAVGLLALATAFSVAAQTRLQDGASVLGNLGSGAATATFGFTAVRGDRIGVRALGLNGLDPVLSVTGPDGAELATAHNDPTTLEPGDSLITFTAPAAGEYSLSMAAEPGTAGDFLLQFEQSPAGSVFPLPAGQSAPIQISAAGGTLRLRFQGSADCPTVLVAHPSGEAGFAALLALTGEQGELLGQVIVGRDEQRLTLASGESSTLIEVTPLPGSSDGEVIFTTACAAEQPACTELPSSDLPAPVAFASVDAAQAQPGGATFYGLARWGEIAGDGAPVAYTFDGAAGDTIALLVTAISPDFDPALSVLGPDQVLLAVAGNTPGSLRPADALLRAVLPESGTYSVLVGSANGAAGNYVMRLAQETVSEATALAADTPAEVDLSARTDGGLQRFTFDAPDACPTALTVSSSGDQMLNPVVVRRNNGEWIGELVPSQLSKASLVVPAGSGGYEVLVAPADVGTLTLQVTCQLQSLACTASGPLLISTPTPAATEVTATSLRAVVTQNANLRTGDSQNFRVIQSLAQGTEVEVIAVSSTGSGWFQVRLADGTEGWVTPFALEVDGNESTLPRLQPGEDGSSAGQSARTSVPRGDGSPIEQPAPTGAPGGGSGEVCGDADCNPMAENAENCPADCPGWCGDGWCNTGAGENTVTCSFDCPA